MGIAISQKKTSNIAKKTLLETVFGNCGQSNFQSEVYFEDNFNEPTLQLRNY